MKWISVLSRGYACLVFITCSVSAAQAYDVERGLGDLLREQEVPQAFLDSFDDLMFNYWDASGNWIGDAQNDATAFAPELLYRVDAAVADQPGPYYERAYQTAQWESLQIDETVKQFFQSGLNESQAFNTAVGTYSYLSCTRFAEIEESGTCNKIIRPILNLANFVLLSPLLEWLGLFQGQEATLYSRLAFMNAEYFKVSQRPYYQNSAKQLIAKMERLANADDDGIFNGDVFGWSQASPLVAYATVYDITGEEQYLIRAERSIAALDQTYLFGEPGQSEAYWEIKHNSLETNTEYWVLASSTHAQFLEAFLILAESTQDPYYWSRTHRFLQFALDYLYIPHHGGLIPHFSHDISWPVNETQPPEGSIRYSDSNYCSGETFNILRLWWRLLENES